MDKAKFFAVARTALFYGKLTPDQVAGMEALLDAFTAARWPTSYAAYGLATALHETARTMQPIAEYGRGKGKKYGKPSIYDGQVAYGRGYVQLTWADPDGIDNYAKADSALGLGGALLKDFDLAMRPDIAAQIMVRGMDEGWFTTRANKHYLNRTPPDYVGARKIINGTDKDTLIAGYAREFEAALRGAGYGQIAPAPPAKPVPAGGVIYPVEPAPAPLEPEPEIVVPKLPEAQKRVGWGGMIIAAMTALFGKRG